MTINYIRKKERDEINKSQDFISMNFDQAIKSIKELKEENIEFARKTKHCEHELTNWTTTSLQMNRR